MDQSTHKNRELTHALDKTDKQSYYANTNTRENSEIQLLHSHFVVTFSKQNLTINTTNMDDIAITLVLAIAKEQIFFIFRAI